MDLPFLLSLARQRREQDATDRLAIRRERSEENLWEPAFDQLRSESVARCELFGRLPEVILTTGSGIRLLTFSTTDGQPQWHLLDRRDGPPRCFDIREGSLHLGDGTGTLI